MPVAHPRIRPLRHAVRVAVVVCLAGCGGPDPEPTTAPDRELLSAEDRLVRASLATRGIRPTPSELQQVRDDPQALAPLVDAFLVDPAFGETIKDMHAELFLTRADADNQLPSVGAAYRYSADDIHEATAEEPLELIRYIVENDRPYTELVTADYMLANEVTATLYGLVVDPTKPGWQLAHWADGRPHAGILSSSELWRRHVSAGSNFHRLRANVLAETLLCESFAARDLEVDGGVDLTDEAAVADAVRTNPNCISCHQALDPLAANLWGFKRQLDPRAVEEAHDLKACTPGQGERPPPIDEGDLVTDYCYPLVMYTPTKEQRWSDLDLRAPGFYGQPTSDLAGLGHAIAADPRFAQCTVRRFYGYYTQQAPDELPMDLVQELQDAFVASGYDARALTREILLSDRFAAVRPQQPGDAPLLSIRPEAYATLLEDLTGFTWEAIPDRNGCGRSCFERVDLLRSDRYGYRASFGGVDGFQVLHPTHTATPNKVLVLQQVAAEAAGFVVSDDFGRPAGERRLLDLVEPDTTDRAVVEAQLAALHDRVLGHHTREDVDETWVLFDDVSSRTDVPTAWATVLTLLLQDPRLVYY